MVSPLPNQKKVMFQGGGNFSRVSRKRCTPLKKYKTMGVSELSTFRVLGSPLGLLSLRSIGGVPVAMVLFSLSASYQNKPGVSLVKDKPAALSLLYMWRSRDTHQPDLHHVTHTSHTVVDLGEGPRSLFWVKKEEITEGRKASWVSKTEALGPLLSSKSGSTTAWNRDRKQSRFSHLDQ